MSMLKRAGALFATLIVLMTMSNGTALAQESPADKVVFTVGINGDLVSPNPFKACCALDYEMLFMNYDMLYNFSQDDLTATDGLASYPPTTSEDGKTWTFKIRDDVTWQDGTPLTAADIAFTYNFIWKNNLAVFRDYLGDPVSFTAPDATTLVWKMKTPSLSPLTPPWVPILPSSVWQQFDNKDQKTIKEFRNVPALGSGPFQLTEWKEGQFVRMEANKDYWGGAPHMDEVIFKEYDNNEALALGLQSGDVDFADALPPTLFNRVRTDPNVGVNVSNANYFDNLAFNFEGSANPAFHNQDVRTAIGHAIDKQTLVDRVLLGNGSVGDSVVLPTYDKFKWTPTGDEVQQYDPDLAKQMLDDAGYKDSNGDGIREMPDGSPFTMELLTISDVTYSVPEGKLIAGWLKDVGIDATVKTVSESKAYDLWAPPGQFDAYIWGWGGDPDPDFILSIFKTSQCGIWSDGCYKDPAYDKMWEQQHTETDPTKRAADIDAMQQYLYEKNPEIVLLYEADLQAYRKDRWTGFVTQPSPVGSILFAFGTDSYLSIHPVGGPQAAGTDGSGGSGGNSPSPWIWIILAVAVVVIVLGVVFMRRGKGDQDTE